jgi:hypothetical protein
MSVITFENNTFPVDSIIEVCTDYKNEYCNNNKDEYFIYICLTGEIKIGLVYDTVSTRDYYFHQLLQQLGSDFIVIKNCKVYRNNDRKFGWTSSGSIVLRKDDINSYKQIEAHKYETHWTTGNEIHDDSIDVYTKYNTYYLEFNTKSACDEEYKSFLKSMDDNNDLEDKVKTDEVKEN